MQVVYENFLSLIYPLPTSQALWNKTRTFKKLLSFHSATQHLWLRVNTAFIGILPYPERERNTDYWYEDFLLFTLISLLDFIKALIHWIFKVKTTDEMLSPFTVLWSAACRSPKTLLQIKRWLDSLRWPCEIAVMCLLSLPSKSTLLNLEVKKRWFS